MELARELRRNSKPMMIAANKADKATDEQLEEFMEQAKGYHVVPTCSEAEMALRKADKAGLIEYIPGSGDFDIPDPSKLNEAQKKALVDRIPLKRLGETRDVANTALFIASDMAAYVTGQVIVVDGGMVM